MVMRSYKNVAANLSQVLDLVAVEREVVVIKGKNVALVAADELAALMETVHRFEVPLKKRDLGGDVRFCLCNDSPPNTTVFRAAFRPRIKLLFDIRSCNA